MKIETEKKETLDAVVCCLFGYAEVSSLRLKAINYTQTKRKKGDSIY